MSKVCILYGPFQFPVILHYIGLDTFADWEKVVWVKIHPFNSRWHSTRLYHYQRTLRHTSGFGITVPFRCQEWACFGSSSSDSGPFIYKIVCVTSWCLCCHAPSVISSLAFIKITHADAPHVQSNGGPPSDDLQHPVGKWILHGEQEIRD